VKKWIPVAAILLAACASTPPAEPPPPPAPAPAPVPQPAEEAVIGTARVTTHTLNVRRAPSLEGEIVTQVKKGERLSILESGDDWIRIRAGDGTKGWVSRPLIAVDGEKAAAANPRRAGCPPDSDFQFAKAPTPAFFDDPAAKHGLVVVEAFVNVKGDVTSTKIVSNSTGDETLAVLAQREMKSAKFVAPVRACVLREFIYTYRRAF